MSEIIYFDSKGIELKRTPKGRGRPPKGARRQLDGSWHVYKRESDTQVDTPHKTFIITIDNEGNEINRVRKGRGRPPRNAVRKPDGNLYIVEGATRPVEIPKVEDEPEEIVSDKVVNTKIISTQPLTIKLWEKVFSHNTGIENVGETIVFHNPLVMAYVQADIDMFNCIYSKATLDRTAGAISVWVRPTKDPDYVMFKAIA